MRWLILIAAMLAGGCSAYTEHRYRPHPASSEITIGPATDAQPVQALATVVGVRKEGAREYPATVEVRFALENNTPVPVRFEPDSLELRGADLERFAPPIVVPDGPAVVPPGERATWTAHFPFAGRQVPGNHDLSGLNLRWRITVGDQPVTRSVSFDENRLTTPPRRSPFGFGVGVGVGL
jgi:hypothetical protein